MQKLDVTHWNFRHHVASANDQVSLKIRCAASYDETPCNARLRVLWTMESGFESLPPSQLDLIS